VSFVVVQLARLLFADPSPSNVPNWIAEWWDTASYMAYRDSVVINISYYYVRGCSLAWYALFWALKVLDRASNPCLDPLRLKLSRLLFTPASDFALSLLMVSFPSRRQAAHRYAWNPTNGADLFLLWPGDAPSNTLASW
jgi:Choline/Carnitine o-acyltransferase